MIKYCASLQGCQRRATREVWIGKIAVGGNHPLRIQSMTTTNTREVEATVEQVCRLADAGCEMVRVTVQGIKEAEACGAIKNRLLQKGYDTPLIADIHFFPPAALRVVEYVEKIRINPGNYADKRATFKQIEYTEASYQEELIRLEEKFLPLLEKCKKWKRALRIGVNHGSLSDRIMNRYGDTPKGMVESAFEFARLCHRFDFHDIVFSMKSSNPQVMIHAYRLLVAEMYQLGWDYPLHLGVTEAGSGEDGRIKSAIGIGALLLDGLGDTLRVSLTEDPWREVDPCRHLISLADHYQKMTPLPFEEKHRDFLHIERQRTSFSPQLNFLKENPVLISLKPRQMLSSHLASALGYERKGSLLRRGAATVDGVIVGQAPCGLQLLSPDALLEASEAQPTEVESLNSSIPLISLRDLEEMSHPSSPYVVLIQEMEEAKWKVLTSSLPQLIILSPPMPRLHHARRFFDWLKAEALSIPVILHLPFDRLSEASILWGAAEYGAILSDGLGEGIWIESDAELSRVRELGFNLMQAMRLRSAKTEFISCPGCGRTLFDLQEVSKKIQSRVGHLPGVKIALMGCIVNGPGEMSDADFGYVGSKTGMVDLYVGKTCVQREIPFDRAEECLVELIKSHGRWIDPAPPLLN